MRQEGEEELFTSKNVSNKCYMHLNEVFKYFNSYIILLHDGQFLTNICCSSIWSYRSIGVIFNQYTLKLNLINT